MITARVNESAWATCFGQFQAKQAWLRVLQEQARENFTAAGFPTRRQERWKYTDVTYLEKTVFNKAEERSSERFDLTQQRLGKTESIFVVLVNGYFNTALSDTALLPANVILSSLQQAFSTHPEIIKTYLQETKNHSAFASLNTALLGDGVFLFIPQQCIVEKPIHILYLNTRQNNFITCPRHIVVAQQHAEATILEEHYADKAADYFINVVTDIHAAENARIEYHKIQNDHASATHISQTFVQQKKDSTVKMCSLAAGSRMNREDIFVALQEPGAAISVNGFYVLNNNDQHIDNHIQIDHAAPHGTSEMMYKGVLDKKSHAVFNGKIHVHPAAQKTHSQQENHNLLLSADSAVDTKPELEIYADDVKCSHGDTVGQLDTESLFYLRSRGIDQHTALKLLTNAFAADVMDRITHPAILQRMMNLLNEKLAHDTGL